MSAGGAPATWLPRIIGSELALGSRDGVGAGRLTGGAGGSIATATTGIGAGGGGSTAPPTTGAGAATFGAAGTAAGSGGSVRVACLESLAPVS